MAKKSGSDFINPFFGRSKIKDFKKILEIPKSHKLLLSLLSGQPNIEEVTNFVVHIDHNRPCKEKSLGESHYNMLKIKWKTDKKKEKKYNTSKDLPPDQSSLKMKNPSSIICHSLHVKLFKFPLCSIRSFTLWVKICGEPVEAHLVCGKSFTHPDYAVDESGEVDESGMVEGSATINGSEIVESEETHFGESEEISENYNGQEEHSNSSEYADSCSDSNVDVDC